jgi:hypothetical protein
LWVRSTPQKKTSKKYFTQIGTPAKNGGGGVRGVYVPVVTTIFYSSLLIETISPVVWLWSFVVKHVSSSPGNDSSFVVVCGKTVRKLFFNGNSMLIKTVDQKRGDHTPGVHTRAPCMSSILAQVALGLPVEPWPLS